MSKVVHLTGPDNQTRWDFYTVRRDAQIVEMRVAGRTYSAIGRHFGISRQRVGGIIKRDRPDLIISKYWRHADDVRMTEMWALGVSIRKIAKAMSKTPGQIAGRLDRLDCLGRGRA